ncbi:Uncharacterised protein [Mycobacteroides abscessus subsp. abscessus]|nr:Uncharacterised protein [Mycobacteroides abscessus subsp. abscessus]
MLTRSETADTIAGTKNVLFHESRTIAIAHAITQTTVNKTAEKRTIRTSVVTTDHKTTRVCSYELVFTTPGYRSSLLRAGPEKFTVRLVHFREQV